MPTILGSIRGLVLAPTLEEVSFSGRGFSVPRTEASERLEAVPQAVVCGFEWAIAAHDQLDLDRRLRLVDVEQRGFAYEGATMAFTILDTVRGHRTQKLLTGSGEKHIFLAYIGIGFAMARLPRVLWKKVLPDLPGARYHPTMSWLAVDGYGFDRAYFDTERWVDRQEIPAPYPWQGSPQYFFRADPKGVLEKVNPVVMHNQVLLVTKLLTLMCPYPNSDPIRKDDSTAQRHSRIRGPGRIASARTAELAPG